jgi:hypothetical protein
MSTSSDSLMAKRMQRAKLDAGMPCQQLETNLGRLLRYAAMEQWRRRPIGLLDLVNISNLE